MKKSKHSIEQQINPPEKRKSKSYIFVHGISGIFLFGGAIAFFVAMLAEHMWIFIFPALFAFLLGLVEIGSVRAVQKHGAKVIPRQVIYPTVRLWRNNGIDPYDIKNRPQTPYKRH